MSQPTTGANAPPTPSQWQPPTSGDRGPGFVQPTLRARLRDEQPLLDETIEDEWDEVATLLREIAQYDLKADRFQRAAELRALVGK